MIPIHAIVKDVAAGALGVVAVVGLAAISLYEVYMGKPFSEPGSLTAIGLAAIAYFFNARQQDAGVAQQNATVQAVKTAINGAGGQGPVVAPVATTGPTQRSE